MALHQRRGYQRRTTTDSPDATVSDQPDDTDDEIEVSDTPEEELVAQGVEVTQFVRIIHGQVGPYPKGSVLPAAAFPYLKNLLELGAVEYDHTAKSQYITGNPEHLAAIQGIGQAIMQTIPNAPWRNAAAHNLLGATYVSLADSQRDWKPLPELVQATNQVESDQTF